jgi:tetratricopeptide (TPR) repeat protein
MATPGEKAIVENRMDYGKWDVIAQEADNDEEREKARRRMENKRRYEKDMYEKKSKFITQKKKENPDFDIHAFEHEQGKHRSCGCGYADVNELKRMQKEREENPPEPLEVKNVRKIEAIEAAHTDANRLFKEGKYDHAFAVYERGVLIINGTFGTSDEVWKQLQAKECTLDLNMAMCKLKQGNYSECITHCKMAKNIDSSRPKVFFRWAQALLGQGNFDDARAQLQVVIDLANASGKPKIVAQAEKEMLRAETMMNACLKKARESDAAFSKNLQKAMAARG